MKIRSRCIRHQPQLRGLVAKENTINQRKRKVHPKPLSLYLTSELVSVPTISPLLLLWILKMYVYKIKYSIFRLDQSHTFSSLTNNIFKNN
jgi:hypothetical protein